MLRERNVRAIMAKKKKKLKKKVGRRNLKMEQGKKSNGGKCDQMGTHNKGE